MAGLVSTYSKGFHGAVVQSSDPPLPIVSTGESSWKREKDISVFCVACEIIPPFVGDE